MHLSTRTTLRAAYVVRSLDTECLLTRGRVALSSNTSKNVDLMTTLRDVVSIHQFKLREKSFMVRSLLASKIDRILVLPSSTRGSFHEGTTHKTTKNAHLPKESLRYRGVKIAGVACGILVALLDRRRHPDSRSKRAQLSQADLTEPSPDLLLAEARRVIQLLQALPPYPYCFALPRREGCAFCKPARRHRLSEQASLSLNGAAFLV